MQPDAHGSNEVSPNSAVDPVMPPNPECDNEPYPPVLPIAKESKEAPAWMQPGEGTAGHWRELFTSAHLCELFNRLCFAAALIGPMSGSTALSFASQIYILQLGADPATLGPLFLIVSFWLPLCSPLAGYLMDKEMLNRWMPTERWGRRAQWFLVHLILLSGVMLGCYLPPSQDPYALVVWVTIISLVGAWCLAVIFISFESARPEIYPLNKDRVVVESMAKVTSAAGSGLAGLLTNAILSNASFKMRLVTSILLCLATFISFIAVPILRTAKSPADPKLIGTMSKEWIRVLKDGAFRHYLGLRFWQGAVEATILTFAVYHITYLCKLTGDDRQNWIFVVGAVLIVTEAVTLPIYTVLFRSGKLDMQKTCGFFHALAAILAPIAIGVLPVSPKVGILLYTIIQRAAFAPQTWFRAVAFCWVVDQDCLAHEGQRREAVYSGVGSFIGNLGRSAAGGFLFLAFSQTGLIADNCHLHCEGSAVTDCVQICQQANVNSQPPAVRQYILLMFCVAAPIFQALGAIHIFLYPIRGQRLEELTAKMAILAKKTEVTRSSSSLDQTTVQQDLSKE